MCSGWARQRASPSPSARAEALRHFSQGGTGLRRSVPSSVGMGIVISGGRTLRPDRPDDVFDIHLSGLGKVERDLHPLAFDKRVLEAEQHEVARLRLQSDALPGLDLQAAPDRTHRHYTAVYEHLVHLRPVG